MGRRARARRSSRFPSASAMAWPSGTLVLLLVAALAATGVAQAQPGGELTVDEVVARALADSPDLRATRAEIDAAVGRLQQAGLRPNPMLELGGQKALSPDNNVMIGLSVPLDLNGRKEGRVAVAERELQMKRAQVRDRERRLAADVRMKAGERGAAPVVDEAVRQALAARPDLDAARADVAMGAAKIRKERAEGRWDASVNVGYQRQDFGFDLNGVTSTGATRPIQDVFHYFGASVSIVLPVRNRNQGNIAAAAAEAQAAERRLQFAELAVRQEVAAALAQYEAARRSRGIYERGVRDGATRNLSVVRQTYGLGRGSLLDVIAEQRRYIDIENGYTDVLRQVYDARVEIDRVTGAMTPAAGR